MYSYFSDLHVQLLARGILQPGEQLLGQTVTQYNPWWALGLFRKTYLVLATDQRLVLVEHRVAWLHQALKLQNVESIPWSNVEETALKGIFVKKLRVRAQGERGPVKLKMAVPNTLFGLLAPMRDNLPGARAVAGAFQTGRQSAALPPSSYGFAPQLPPQNAPGYTSVAPPSPFAQPQQQQQQQPAAPMGAPGYPPRWPHA
jgi:hypothetical protein